MNSKFQILLTGVGSYLPKKKISNYDLEKLYYNGYVLNTEIVNLRLEINSMSNDLKNFVDEVGADVLDGSITAWMNNDCGLERLLVLPKTLRIRLEKNEKNIEHEDIQSQFIKFQDTLPVLLMREFYFETCTREAFWLFLGFRDRGLL